LITGVRLKTQFAALLKVGATFVALDPPGTHYPVPAGTVQALMINWFIVVVEGTTSQIRFGLLRSIIQFERLLNVVQFEAQVELPFPPIEEDREAMVTGLNANKQLVPPNPCTVTLLSSAAQILKLPEELLVKPVNPPQGPEAL